MQRCRTIKLGEIRNEKLRGVQRLAQRFLGKAIKSYTFLLEASTHELNDLRHLDLRENPASLVPAKFRYITNGECIRTLDGDLSRFTSVQLSHTLDFSECHKVTIFEPMASFI